jgi:hypothetical protein
MSANARDEESYLISPEVKNCAVQECFYNRNELCHAAAITVGSDHPACDTFIQCCGGDHGIPAPMGHVGACHEGDCKFNTELSCHAGSINVAHHGDHADCVTYEPIESAESEITENFARQTEDVVFEGSRASRIERTEEQ